MSQNDLLGIVLLGFVAGFLIIRLMSVLGTRNGAERKRDNPFVPRDESQNTQTPRDIAVIDDRERTQPAQPSAAPLFSGPGLTVSGGLAQIKYADDSFNVEHFLTGARTAFKMIVEAFAAGKTDTLRPLLSAPLYQAFSGAIAARAPGEKEETAVSEIRAADITDARLQGTMARITVRFVSRQTRIVRGPDGNIVHGNADTPEEVTDIWTFERDTQSGNPNWQLVETRTAEG